MSSEQAKKTVIVYHANCIDGTASAFVIAEVHGLAADDADTAYIPYEHYMRKDAEDKVRANLGEDSTVYFVDVAPEKAFLDELTGKAKAIHVYDHHKSAAVSLKDYAPPTGAVGELQLKIDAHKPSNAMYIWRLLRPGVAPPAFFAVIDGMDGDASGLDTRQKKEIAAYLDSHDTRTPEKAFAFFKNHLKETFNAMAEKGRAILLDQEERLSRVEQQAAHIELQVTPDAPAEMVTVVNANVQHFGRGISERLITLAKTKGRGIAMAWFVTRFGGVEVSLRSSGDPDLTQVVNHLKSTTGCDGGGHAKASVIRFKSVADFIKHIPLSSASPAATPKNHMNKEL